MKNYHNNKIDSLSEIRKFQHKDLQGQRAERVFPGGGGGRGAGGGWKRMTQKFGSTHVDIKDSSKSMGTIETLKNGVKLQNEKNN
jgi:hypothetical protein